MPGIITETLFAALGALALVLAHVLLAKHAASWGGLAPRGTGRLAVVEAIALDPRRRLSLVRCDGRHLLLLTGGAQDVVVGWTDAAPLAKDPMPDQPSSPGAVP